MAQVNIARTGGDLLLPRAPCGVIQPLLPLLNKPVFMLILKLYNKEGGS